MALVRDRCDRRQIPLQRLRKPLSFSCSCSTLGGWLSVLPVDLQCFLFEICEISQITFWFLWSPKSCWKRVGRVPWHFMIRARIPMTKFPRFCFCHVPSRDQWEVIEDRKRTDERDQGTSSPSHASLIPPPSSPGIPSVPTSIHRTIR